MNSSESDFKYEIGQEIYSFYGFGPERHIICDRFINHNNTKMYELENCDGEKVTHGEFYIGTYEEALKEINSKIDYKIKIELDKINESNRYIEFLKNLIAYKEFHKEDE